IEPAKAGGPASGALESIEVHTPKNSQPLKPAVRDPSLSEIKQQELRLLRGRQRDRSCRARRGAIAGGELLIVRGESPARDLNPRVTPGADLPHERSPRLENRGVQGGVLMDGDRSVAAVRRGDDAEPVEARLPSKLLLTVPGRHPVPVGHDPDLEEVDALGLRRVGL